MRRERDSSPLFLLVVMITVIAALFVAKEILLPIALAVLLSFLLTPLANRIERWRVPRIPSVLIVVGFAFSILAVLGWVVTSQLIELSRELPTHQGRIIAKIKSVTPTSPTFDRISETVQAVGDQISGGDSKDALESKSGSDELPVGQSEAALADATDNEKDDAQSAESVSPKSALEAIADPQAATNQRKKENAVEVKVVSMPPSPLTQVQTWLGPLVTPLTTAGMVIVLVFFMLLDRENQRNRLIQLFGTANLHTTTEAIHDATQRVGRYLRMQFLINAGYGVAVSMGLWLIGVPSAIMWGVLGFSLRFLPYIGPWIAAIMPILVSLAISDGWTKSILVVGMYVGYELLLNNVAEPMLYGSSVGVSTVGVIISAIFWTWLWGPIGLILAMPMTVCLVVLARYIPSLRFITVLLADQPPLSPAERIYQRLLAFDYNEPLRMARHHLKTFTLMNLYDEVLIPALTLAEQDRHAGLLNAEQDVYVQESAEELIDELGEHAKSAAEVLNASNEEHRDPPIATAAKSTGGDPPTARVLCIPLRDEADELVSRMLAQLLSAEGFHVEASATGTLTSEMVEQVSTSDSDVVIISVLPPIRPSESRLLWRRLRQRYPDLPIIVGYWTGTSQSMSLAQPEQDDASKVVSTLAEALAQIRTTCAQLQLAKAV